MGAEHLPRPSAMAPLLPHEMEHIRKVYDEDVSSKKFASIVSPREDAQMFRSGEQRSVPCECIVELYELLWRWGHRKKSRFAENFGFTIPDTVVIAKGRPYAWYFVSRKDGSLLRKSEGNLSLSALERKLVGDRDKDGRESAQPCAIWLPMASQFPESRSPTPYAEFLSVKGLQEFIMLLRERHSGIIQAFVQPFGVSNSLVRTVEFRRQTSLCLRTNRSLLAAGGNIFDRCATFEGWEGLSSVSSRYRNHRHPHMEDVILAASETLNRRIEQERVRQMLFLGPHQHVALHFKVAADGVLNFIFASIVSEKDVILQTRYHLIMADPCMTEELNGAALLPGGTTRKAQPHEAPTCYSARGVRGNGAGNLEEVAPPAKKARPDSLPPIELRRRESGRHSESQEGSQHGLLPRMGYEPPAVPEVPYRTLDLPRTVEDYERFAAHDNGEFSDLCKRPLVVHPLTERNERTP